jgi:uncharacterized membrane protein YeaQ/YmgE (transglycosylase-associated protein family)
MLNVLFWIIIGAVNGWIGYLATRTVEHGHPRPYIVVGMIGGMVGGMISRLLGMDETEFFIGPSSAFNALIFSALFVSLYVAVLNFFGKASSR